MNESIKLQRLEVLIMDWAIAHKSGNPHQIEYMNASMFMAARTLEKELEKSERDAQEDSQ